MRRVPCLAGALLAPLLALAGPASADPGACLLCAPSATPPAAEVPLRIEITAGLEFSRAAIGEGGGAIRVDPSGNRQVSGGLTDLGGMALAGQVMLTGEPGRIVRIILPGRIELSDGRGSHATVEDIATDLPAEPRLDASGRLRFAFGGRLVVRGQASGNLRGRIPITADYE